MKLVSSETMQLIDRESIENLNIPASVLMEKAGRSVADIVHERYYAGGGSKAVILCGTGNNGGDGFVAARYLAEYGWHPFVIILGNTSKITSEASKMLSELSSSFVRKVTDESELLHFLASVDGCRVIIDAMFGTGLSKPVAGIFAAAVAAVNKSSFPVVSVDVPSGINASTGAVLGSAVEADVTVTFGLAKIGLYTGSGVEYSGEVFVTDIGFPRQLLDNAKGVELVDTIRASSIIKPRKKCCHKGDNGHILIVAGSTGKSGAAVMSANSSVRAGAGLVTAAVPASLNLVMEIKTTEAMSVPVGADSSGNFTGSDIKEVMVLTQGKSSVAVGPGLGSDKGTSDFVCTFFQENQLPAVYDADALNAFASRGVNLAKRNAEIAVITPHPGEMSRLCGLTVPQVENDRIGTAVDYAVSNRVYVILKGAGSVIASPDGRSAVNRSGNPGMATGGSGDVLTGIAATLLAQNYDPFEACILAVHIHGTAGDLAAEEKGFTGISATDIQEKIPNAIKFLHDFRNGV